MRGWFVNSTKTDCIKRLKARMQIWMLTKVSRPASLKEMIVAMRLIKSVYERERDTAPRRKAPADALLKSGLLATRIAEEAGG